MALTITQDGRADHSGSTQKVYLTVTFDDSYPSTGEPFVANDYGLGRAIDVTITQRGPNTKGHVFQYDYTNEKIVVFQVAQGDGAGPQPGAAAPLEEVGDTADLSDIVVSVCVTSRR